MRLANTQRWTTPLALLSLVGCMGGGIKPPADSDTDVGRDTDTIDSPAETDAPIVETDPTDTDSQTDTDAPDETDATDTDTSPGIETLVAGDLVITEIMTDPLACVDERAEYFEVLYRGNETIDLAGLRVADNGAFYDVPAGTLVSPGDYVIFYRNPLGGMDQCYGLSGVAYLSSIALANGGDELTLSDGSGLIYDQVVFPWERREGASFSLDPSKLDAQENDDRSAWCFSTEAIGSTTDRGSPGVANAACDGGPPSDTGADTDDEPGDTASIDDTAAPGDTAVTGDLSLLISELVDYGPDYTVRYLEIFNPTDVAISLSGWSIERYANGNTTSQGVALPDQPLAPGATFVVGRAGSGDFAGVFGRAPDLQSGVVDGNGDDTFALTYSDGSGNTVVDVYGVIGVDGTGEIWEYTDATATRVDGIDQPSSTWIASEWVLSSDASATTFGVHPAGVTAPVDDTADTATLDSSTDDTATDDTATDDTATVDSSTDDTATDDTATDDTASIDTGIADTSSEGPVDSDTSGVTDTSMVVDTGATATPPDLLISEVVDYGPDFALRFVEIYNPTDTAVWLTDWSLARYSNGGTTAQSVTLPDQPLFPGQTFVIGRDGGGDFLGTFGREADFLTAVVDGNGDDAFALVYGSPSGDILVDVFGNIGEDGSGTAWEYTDAVATRIATVTAPSDTFRLNEWVISTDATAASPAVHPVITPVDTGASADTDDSGQDTDVTQDTAGTTDSSTGTDTDQTTTGDTAEDSATAQNPLFLSEIADPSTYQARFVELYNAGSTDAPLAGMELRRYSNGSTTASAFSLPDTSIAPGATFVIAYNDTEFTATFGITADAVWGGVNSNGDDVYALAMVGAPDDEVLDVYGEIGVDGTGTNWEFVDSAANRTATITSASPLFDVTEWIISDAPADFTPGVHPAP